MAASERHLGLVALVTKKMEEKLVHVASRQLAICFL